MAYTVNPYRNSADTARSARVLAHPLRVRILEEFRADPAIYALSPTALAERLEERLGNVAYHVRQLETERALELVHTAPVRGTLEHFYRPTAYGWRLAEPLYVCPTCLAADWRPGDCRLHERTATRVGPYVLAR